MAPKLQQTLTSASSRILLVALLVISLALVSIYFREGEEGPLHQAQSSASGMVRPLKFVGATLGSATDAAGTAIENVSASETTLEALRAQNQELRKQIVELEEYRQEAIYLEELLRLKNYYDLDIVSARVTGRSFNAWEKVITINRGSRDGVITGLPVMGQSGVIGQVIAVRATSADVRLLQDPQSGVAVLIQSNRAEGIVKGALDGLLYLENLDVDATVQVGDVIITSGLGGSYFRGLTLGTVVKIEENQGGSTRKIVVAPNATTRSLEEVSVVLSMNSEGDATEPVAPPKKDDEEAGDDE
ncbi:MAG: rod shape-determining protein MreC [Eggerthellaceae bacterium]|jgi:rod shape-determining protein MreC|nr:rod shape-determining protein MreC [Eggerthellaceae bacterium]